MTVTRLPFGFARDQQVLLAEHAIIAGPNATSSGLREALRCGGPDLPLNEVDDAEFEQRLMALYRGGSDTATAEDEDGFVLDDSALEPPPQDLLETGSDAPVIRLVNHLLRRTVEARASDLHVEPHEQGLRARIRVDGFLQTIYDTPVAPARQIISRLKIMSGLDIAETRLPQDGHIALRYGGRSIDVRVSTLPGNYGERVVMRVLDKTTGLMPLADLGLRPHQIELLETLSATPNGIVLATGPTGSGKTTTLYSLLKLANKVDRNILTIEDPIEYDLPGINQSQIRAEIGMTFAAGLRASLRQDPDIILVGEVRDHETASAAAQAALTGHLVFSSLHANSAVASIIRLRDLGLDDYLVAATVRAIIAQRLLRKLCPDCRSVRAPDASEIQAFTTATLSPPDMVHGAVGCPACRGSGYAGRVGIYEIVTVDDALRDAIDSGASEQTLTALALPPDRTLLGEALQLVASGQTDMAEVRRVIGTAT